MFRDSGRYPSFFPDDDDIFGDAHMLNEYPDLECNIEGGLIKHSLFNVFKILRPVVVLDEAHKAYGAKKRESNEEFARSISRLDPSMVIELSATPNRGISNLLVDIEGPDLKKEEMIKLPVQVTSFPNAEMNFRLFIMLSKSHISTKRSKYLISHAACPIFCRINGKPPALYSK